MPGVVGQAMLTGHRNMNTRLYALQALRAYAAAMVVFIHAVLTFVDKAGGAYVMRDGALGEMGVKLFFCISGFIIFSSSINLAPGWKSAAGFMARRIVRVAPIYWLATAIYTIKLQLQGVSVSLNDFFQSVFFIPYDTVAGLMRPILGVGWTLNYEMFFYFLVGASLFLVRRLRAPLMVLLLVGLVCANIFGYLAEGGPGLSHKLYLLSSNYLLYFLVGLSLGVVKNELMRRRDFPLLRPGHAVLISFIFVVCYLLLDGIFNLHGLAGEALMLVFCVLTMAVCLAESRAKAPSRGLLSRLLQGAGDGSYSTYLTHGFVMGPAARAIAYFKIPIDSIVFSTSMVFICSFVGYWVYRLVERPILMHCNSRIARFHSA